MKLLKYILEKNFTWRYVFGINIVDIKCNVINLIHVTYVLKFLQWLSDYKLHKTLYPYYKVVYCLSPAYLSCFIFKYLYFTFYDQIMIIKSPSSYCFLPPKPQMLYLAYFYLKTQFIYPLCLQLLPTIIGTLFSSLGILGSPSTWLSKGVRKNTLSLGTTLFSPPPFFSPSSSRREMLIWLF